MFYDKLQRRQLLYALTSSGKEQLLEVRYDSLSRPLKFEAKGAFDDLEASYDIFGNLQKWTWGPGLSEAYTFDKAGRLTEVTRSNNSVLGYDYKDAFSALPASVSVGKAKYSLVYDAANGGLKRIQTPRGHFHSFNVKADVGHIR